MKMIDLDILFVTYRSEKWINDCIGSIAASQYDLSRVGLYFVDNASDDDTVSRLYEAKARMGSRFREFYIEKSQENMGFGRGNNAAARLGCAPYVFCLNIDTKMYPDTLKKLCEAIEEDVNSAVAVWELRQHPYEHPKDYDPLTGETSWVSGAAFAVRRDVFERVGGFDESIFMYGEDVDLSWRIRAQGYSLRYVPKAVVDHFCYQKTGEVKPTQFIYSAVYNQLLRAKFGGMADRLEGYFYLALKLIKGAPFKGARGALVKAWFKEQPVIRAAKTWRAENIEKIRKQKYTFYGFQYELMREGDFVPCGRPKGNKKVSVIVRTCGRPAVLRETLLSLRAQTYPNIEIVVVEDGPEVSKEMIEAEFSDLNIVYKATGKKRGRCVNGNMALGLSTGDYLNFLDDDDLFFADHVETLVYALEQNPKYRIAYALGFETPVLIHSREPYRYTVKDVRTTFCAEFDLQELLCHNITPIQAVMFERSVFEACGGFDEQLDVMEDWELWVRYALHSPFLFVPKTTSIYRVPADRRAGIQRAQEMDKALETVSRRYAAHRDPSNGGSLKQRILGRRARSGVGGLAFKGVRGAYRLMKGAKRRLRRRMGRTI